MHMKVPSLEYCFLSLYVNRGQGDDSKAFGCFCFTDRVRGWLGPQLCHPASFRPLLAETPLPSGRTFGSIHQHEHPRFSYRGLLASP